jgi:cell division septum initiation protein DivIVA
VSEPGRVPAEIRRVAFPVAALGYDRRAVDVYITRVNRLIAELEATCSPQRADERALERTKKQRSRILEEASGILEDARETAAEITAAAQRKAEDVTSRTKTEAVDIIVNASDEADRTKTEADEHVARARIEAEKILADSRTEAADQLERAQEEIAGLRKEAETWMRALRLDTNAIWGERRDLLNDLRDIATRLQKAASHSAARASSHDASSV